MQRVLHLLHRSIPSVQSCRSDGIRRVHDMHHGVAPTTFSYSPDAPTTCSLSNSGSPCVDRKKQKFWQRRLRGAHVPASDNFVVQSFDEEKELEILDDRIFPVVSKCPATYSALLRRCCKPNLGMLLHHHIINYGLEHIDILQNLLVHMYNRCCLMYDASCLFNCIPFRDEFSWNFMISACNRHGRVTETTQMFEKMLGEGILPNKFIYTSVLLAYSSHEVLAQGRRLHAQITGTNFDLDALLGNSLVGMYCKCGELDDAKRSFDLLFEQDVVSWAAMVSAHSKQGRGKEALYFFKQMQQSGVLPNMATFVSVLDACANENVIFEGHCLHACFAGSDSELDLIFSTALLNLYGKHGDLSQAWEIFNRMQERNVVSWNSMITAFLLQSQAKDVLVLFGQMLQEGAMPDKFIYVSVFSAYATKEDLTDGKRMYSRLFGSNFQSDTIVLTSVLNMFFKCGSIKDAEETTFDNAQGPDDVLWTSIISGYAQHGQGKKALQLFKCMQQEGPCPSVPVDEVTYTSVLSACNREVTCTSVLSACNHEGLVDEGVHHLLSMSRDYGIQPTVEHYNCIIDLLARSGQLDKAEDLITSISGGATLVSWTSLLDACRKHSDLERGQRAARRVFELDANASSPYILLLQLTKKSDAM